MDESKLLETFELCVAKKVLVMGGGKFDLVGTVDELLNFSGTGVCYRHQSAHKEAPTNPLLLDLTSQKQLDTKMYITDIDARIF